MPSGPAPKTSLDRALHAQMARFTLGLSPAAMALAYFDWLVHLWHSPGKLAELLENASVKGRDYASWAALAAPGAGATPRIAPLAHDPRFRDPGWQRWPFNVLHQGFLMHEQWWHYATTGVPGVGLHHQDLVSFCARQWLDLCSPSNFAMTNPEVIERTVAQGGMNLVCGARNFVEDVFARIGGPFDRADSEFRVGCNLAATPGKVIHRNRLCELIQYEPATSRVRAEPILVVPAWIMKYYIMDLSAHNSMVRFLVEQGFTVFMISWKNPGPEDRDVGMEDYLRLGVMESLDAVNAIVPETPVHGVGYCLGGTLLAIAAAAMGRSGDERFGTLSLFASQTDFTEAGELKLFIDESQLAFLEDIMWDRGYLDNDEMAGAFRLLRTKDLVWSRMVREYLLGERSIANDLMAWNADATRMPYRMHAEYLRKLYLHNDLAGGRFEVDGHKVALSDIRPPVFVVGTEKDHVAPWRSVYKAHLLLDAELTFLLTAGGHNAGIVSEPGHPRRHYRIHTRRAEEHYRSPDSWIAKAARHDGSWWPAWVHWLDERSPGRRERPRPAGTAHGDYPALADAPGEYVQMR